MRRDFLFAGVLVLVFLSGCARMGLSEYEKKQRGNALFRQAVAAEASGDIDGAIKLYKQVMIEEPKAYSAHFMLATLLHDHTEDYISAIYHYKRYMELEPESEKAQLARERIKIAEHLLAPKLVRKVEESSPSLQQAHLLKEAARLNGIIARLEGEKAELTDRVQKNETVLKELSAENAQLRKIVEKMRGAESVEGSEVPIRERIGSVGAGERGEGPGGLSKEELDALRREAAASKVDGASESSRKPVVEVPSVKSVLEKVQNRLGGPDGAGVAGSAERDREARETAKKSDLSEFSLFKTQDKDEAGGTDSREKQIYVVQPGDTLMRIASRFYGDDTKWKRIRDANRGQIGPDGRVRAGQNIVIP